MEDYPDYPEDNFDYKAAETPYYYGEEIIVEPDGNELMY
jgi:hypothetical protein